MTWHAWKKLFCSLVGHDYMLDTNNIWACVASCRRCHKKLEIYEDDPY